MTNDIEQAINLLHSAEYWYDTYGLDSLMTENAHARTAKALQIVAFSEEFDNE